MPIQIKGKVYKSMIRPVMMYGAETWTLGVACITDKVREARMRWYGHVMRREDGCCIKRIMNAEVYGRRSRGRKKKRWRDKIQEDLKTLKLKKEDADNRNKWRRIRVADPSPRRD